MSYNPAAPHSTQSLEVFMLENPKPKTYNPLDLTDGTATKHKVNNPANLIEKVEVFQHRKRNWNPLDVRGVA